MSTENQSQCAEKKQVLSPSAQENPVGEQGSKTTVLCTDGTKKITDITDSSAAQLLKTIVIASQNAAHQQRLANGIDSINTMENTLPHDLQSFKGDPFVQILDKAQNGHAQQQNAQYVIQGLQEMNTTPTNFNGVNTNLINGFVNSNKSKTATEDLHGSEEQDSILNGSEMPTFENLSAHNQQSHDFSIEKNGVLQRLLSGGNIADRGLHVTIPSGSSTVSSPADYSKSSPTSSANSPYGDSNLSPFGENTDVTSYMETDGLRDLSKTVNVSDTTTQSSLITHTNNLQLDSIIDKNIESEVKYDMACEWDVTKLDENLDRAKTCKVPRLPHDSDASSALSPSVDNVFRAEGAQQEVPSDFTFQLFGQGDSEQNPIGVFSGIVTGNGEVSPSQNSPPMSSTGEQPFKTPQALPQNVVKQQRERLRRAKEPILSQAFPSKIHGYELRILQQPEEQHRARYLTEGSRGSVKNRSGSAFPQVKLFGYSGEATLQIFIGNDSGRVRPHGFYQACKVCGKNSTMCTEKDIDGTTVIEIELSHANDMTASVDCVGILKLRNADVEQRIGIAKAKKKSTKARMIFRVTFQKPCGNPQVLQVASSTILCTQPVGQPEICKMSLKECAITGGEELFIIGKNFLRGTQLLFQQASEDDSNVMVWQKEAEIDKDYFQTTHMIVTVPEYTGKSFLGQKIECQVVVNSGGKLSDPQPIFYKPVDPKNVVIKQDVMDTVEESRKRNYPFVAPEALELNQQIQQVQQVSNSSDMFQLPPGIISGMSETNGFIPMEQGTKEGVQTDQSSTNENLSEDLGNEGNNNFSLDQKTFGQDHDTNNTWDPEQNSVNDTNKDKDELNLDLSNLNYSSMNTEEFNEDSDFVRLKSPRLSNEELFNGHIGIHNPPASKEDSVVSQFLQNISMALKESDPMFSGNQTLVSEMVTDQSSNMQTIKNNNQQNKRTKEKSQNFEHSFLKEALTCPPASLQHQNIHTLTNQKTIFEHKVETGVSDMNMQVDSNSSDQGLKLEEIMDYNLTNSEHKNTSEVQFESETSCSVNNSAQFSEPNTVVSYSPSINSQAQEEVQFSPSHVFAAWNKSPTINIDTKPVFCVVEGGPTHSAQGATEHIPDLINTFTHESKSHQKTIMSSMVQDQLKTAGLQQNEPLTMVNHLHHKANSSENLTQQLKSTDINQTNQINAVLQQMLSHTGIGKQDGQHYAEHETTSKQQHFVTPVSSSQQQQQQQQQIKHQSDNVNDLQQQQQHLFTDHQLQQQQQQQQLQQQMFQHTEQDQPLTPQQQHYQQPQFQQQQSIEQQQNQPHSQAVQQQLNPAIQQQAQKQPQYFQLQQKQQQAVQLIEHPGMAVPTQSMSGQTSLLSSIPNQSQNPLAPQIIICNNPSTGNQLPQAQFGSPSIVIVPGQAGPNNQVENLLRSILGSMMQPQQQQQQQQQENSKQPSP